MCAHVCTGQRITLTLHHLCPESETQFVKLGSKNLLWLRMFTFTFCVGEGGAGVEGLTESHIGPELDVWLSELWLEAILHLGFLNARIPGMIHHTHQI